jgi:hypothetical protein
MKRGARILEDRAVAEKMHKTGSGANNNDIIREKYIYFP